MGDDEKLTAGGAPVDASADPGTSTLILVTGDEDIEYTERAVKNAPADHLLVLAYHDDTAPVRDRVDSIAVDGRKRLLVTEPEGHELESDGTVAQCPPPTDLSTAGIEISSFLDEHEGAVVCLHSLTALLDEIDVEHLYRFLHILAVRISDTDAVGQFYLDAAAHDDQTIYMLRSVFDVVVETDPIARFSR